MNGLGLRREKSISQQSRFRSEGPPAPAAARWPLVFLVGLALLAGWPAGAQWVTQTFTLEPGWNSVFLEVEPEQNGCDAVFDGIPLDAVCAWNPSASPTQYITNPEDILSEHEEWLVYFSPHTPARVLTDLFIVRGGKPYLIKLAGEEDVVWTVQGRPVPRSLDWQADSFNLAGFPAAEGGGPTFQNFFASSQAHAGQPMYRLNASDEWELVSNPAGERLSKGEAYWVYTAGQSDYQGPLGVTLSEGRGLNFSDTLMELTVRLENETGTGQTFSVEVLDSEEPAAADVPALAGAVPLSYWDQDALAWEPFDGAASFEVEAGGEYQLRLAVRRSDMVAVKAAKQADESLYQGLVAISHGGGNRVLVPTTSLGLGSVAKGKAVHPRAGLWLGSATVNAVSELIRFSDPEVPTPTDSEFTFRLIVHVDADGTARLLQHVTQMWQVGSLRPDPDAPGLLTLDEPGNYVLIADDALLDSFDGAAVRDGSAVGRRVSSPAFGFEEPIEMSGGFPSLEFLANTATCTVALDYDDPLNPFKHKYHPSHNNLNENYDEELRPEGRESYTVTRDITLAFSGVDPEGLELAGWGDNQLGGTYEEAVTGIHKETVRAAGFFRLRRVSSVAELDPEPAAR